MITGTPSGTQQLIVNGRESNLGVFAILAVAVELDRRRAQRSSSGAISLPDVDVDAEVPVSSTFNTTIIANPSLPGVELELSSAGSAQPRWYTVHGQLR